MHTLPSIAAHLDLYFWNHQTFKNCKVVKGLGLFAIIYCFIVHYVYYVSGSWAYPILGELSPPFRIAFISATMITIYIKHISCRLNSSMNKKYRSKMKVLFHLAAFGLYAWTCYEDYFLVSGELLPIPNQFFSKFVWLTLIDLYSQLIYHFVGIILALFFDKKRHPIYDYIARALIGPIGVSVTVLFWALYLADPGTLAKDEMGRKNSCDEMKFSKTAVLKGIGIFVTLYLIDIHYVYYTAGFWAYPILGKLALPFRLLFIVVCMLVVYSSYLWLSLVNSFINKDKKKAQKKN
ncbi:unnamed protein product [Caenorhabditis angaria]|uniref:Uncharacterized protein n=1 Tax=Caenorhabditis angaria TaxID=860376 RepID=A0A9P1J5M1_9PELO|nr:unnamed protein product [Caenorhabditis angaria]